MNLTLRLPPGKKLFVFSLFVILFFPRFSFGQCRECRDDMPDWQYQYHSLYDQLGELKEYFEDFGYCKQTKENKVQQDITLVICKKSTLHEKILVAFDIQFVSEVGYPLNMQAIGVIFDKDQSVRRGFGNNPHSDLQVTADIGLCPECKVIDMKDVEIEDISITFQSGPLKDKTFRRSMNPKTVSTTPVTASVTPEKKKNEAADVAPAHPAQEAAKKTEEPAPKTDIEKIREANKAEADKNAEQARANNTKATSSSSAATAQTGKTTTPGDETKDQKKAREKEEKQKAKEQQDREKNEKKLKDQQAREQQVALAREKQAKEREAVEQSRKEQREKALKEKEETASAKKDKDGGNKKAETSTSKTGAKKDNSGAVTSAPEVKKENQEVVAPDKPAEAPVTETPVASSPAPTAEKEPETKETPPHSATMLIPYSKEEYDQKIKAKVEALQENLQQITDRTLSNVVVNKITDQSVKMFLTEESIVAISSLNAPLVKKYRIREYLNKLSRLPYEKVKIEWTDIYVVDNFKLGPDQNYHGTVSFKQKFQGFNDNVQVYGDVQRKNMDIILRQYSEIEAGQLKRFWDILFGDIKVDGDPERN